MMRCAPSDVGATNIGGRCVCAAGVAAGVGAVVVAAGRQAASAHESAMPPRRRAVERGRVIIGVPLGGGLGWGRAKIVVASPAREDAMRRLSAPPQI
jgi:hypothetical protein